MSEYTLEIYDGLTGEWVITDSATSLDTLMDDGDFIDDDSAPWRIIKTEIVLKSDNQPIGS